jgi:AraC-like DNA-binding protein
LDQPIRIKELSGIAGRSPSYFCHAFKRTFGETPHAYVINRRLERAGELMLQSDALLTEIAYNCGFTDQAHLSKQFRQRTGQPPSVWRRERRDAASISDEQAFPSGPCEPREADGLRHSDRAFPRAALSAPPTF